MLNGRAPEPPRASSPSEARSRHRLPTVPVGFDQDLAAETTRAKARGPVGVSVVVAGATGGMSAAFSSSQVSRPSGTAGGRRTPPAAGRQAVITRPFTEWHVVRDARRRAAAAAVQSDPSSAGAVSSR